jgi:hypothetical protein
MNDEGDSMLIGVLVACEELARMKHYNGSYSLDGRYPPFLSNIGAFLRVVVLFVARCRVRHRRNEPSANRVVKLALRVCGWPAGIADNDATALSVTGCRQAGREHKHQQIRGELRASHLSNQQL